MGRKHHADVLAGSSLAFHALIVRLRLVLVIAQRRMLWGHLPGFRLIPYHQKLYFMQETLRTIYEQMKGGDVGVCTYLHCNYNTAVLSATVANKAQT